MAPTPSKPFIVIGHRGASGYLPENTLASFERAIELGARWVEFDVHLASDGVPVVIHDPTLDRTTLLRGRVNAFSSAQLAAPCISGGLSVPTLAEVLGLLGRHGVGAYVEVKDSSPSAAPIVLAALGPSRPDRIISSFDLGLLRQVRQEDPSRPIQALFTAFPAHFERIVERLSPTQLGVRFGYLSSARARQVLGLGLPVMTYTVNTASGLARAKEMGLDGAFCDFPDMAPAPGL